jgi:hypothetical protein
MAKLSLEIADGEQSKRWQAILNYSYIAEQKVEAKANLRLTLTQMSLHI